MPFLLRQADAHRLEDLGGAALDVRQHELSTVHQVMGRLSTSPGATRHLTDRDTALGTISLEDDSPG